jgi:hypothetical protein
MIRTTRLLLLSLLVFTHVQAQPECPNQICQPVNPCHDQCWKGRNVALFAGGAALIGGVAGAVVGSCSSHKHHSHSEESIAIEGEKGSKGDKGDRGDKGEKGDRGANGERGLNGFSPFTIDEGETLAFLPQLQLNIAELPGGEAEVTFFITSPDGTVTQTPTLSVDLPVNAANTPNLTEPIEVPAMGGTYLAGAQVRVSGAPISDRPALSGTIAYKITASRDDTTTVTNTQAGATDILTPPLPTDLQLDTTFAYEFPAGATPIP